MKQSRTMSLVEAIMNVVIGYGVAVATQMLVLPWFGLHMSLAQNLKLAIAFTFISFARSFVLRRLFEWFRAANLFAVRDEHAGRGRSRHQS